MRECCANVLAQHWRFSALQCANALGGMGGVRAHKGLGIGAVTAPQEARWQADRERCWRAFVRNAQRVLEAPEGHRGRLLARYEAEAAARYGAETAAHMAQSLATWVRSGVH